jgi:hypothetical protein
LKDLKILTVTVWWRTAQDRDLWSKIIRRPRHTKGCNAKEEEEEDEDEGNLMIS